MHSYSSGCRPTRAHSGILHDKQGKENDYNSIFNSTKLASGTMLVVKQYLKIIIQSHYKIPKARYNNLAIFVLARH